MTHPNHITQAAYRRGSDVPPVSPQMALILDAIAIIKQPSPVLAKMALERKGMKE